MQYLLIFVAVLLVVGCMTVFMFTAIRQLALRIREQVNSRYIQELSLFDSLCEEKMERLRQLKEEEALANSNIFRKPEERREESPAAQAVSVASGGELPVSKTSNPHFLEDYRYVRDAFQLNVKELVDWMSALPADPMWQLGEAAGRLLESLTAQAAFEALSLDEEEQLALLEDTLDEEGRQLLLRYRQEQEMEGQGSFSILAFRQYVVNLKRLYSGDVTVYAGDEAICQELSGVTVVRDPSICEGVRVLRGNRLYDYSI